MRRSLGSWLTDTRRFLSGRLTRSAAVESGRGTARAGGRKTTPAAEIRTFARTLRPLPLWPGSRRAARLRIRVNGAGPGPDAIITQTSPLAECRARTEACEIALMRRQAAAPAALRLANFRTEPRRAAESCFAAGTGMS